MKEINDYLETMFRPYPQTPRLHEARQELQGMMEDAYANLIAGGATITKPSMDGSRACEPHCRGSHTQRGHGAGGHGLREPERTRTDSRHQR